MLDPTTALQPIPQPPTASQADLPDLQRYHLLLILRDVPSLVLARLPLASRLALSGMLGGMVRNMAGQVAAMSDDQTRCLMTFLQQTLADVHDSDLADEQFTERFTSGFEAVDAAFTANKASEAAAQKRHA